MLNSELQETLRNSEEIQLTKMKIKDIKDNQAKIKEELKQAYDYKSQTRTSFISGVLQTTGSVIGNIFLPVFGGIFGYGVSGTAAQRMKENIDKKVESNLRKID